MIALLLGLVACTGAEFSIEGSVNDSTFTPVTAFWGGPFIAFVDTEVDCQDMFWLQRINLEGEEPPTDKDLKALQITYNNEEGNIVTGTYTVGGEAPIKSEFLGIAGEEFTVDRALEGVLELDEKVDEESISGSFNFTFASGSLEGTFSDVTWCMNIRD